MQQGGSKRRAAFAVDFQAQLLVVSTAEFDGCVELQS